MVKSMSILRFLLSKLLEICWFFFIFEKEYKNKMRSLNKLAFIIIILFCHTVRAQMSGVYTIGGSTGSTNFTSWANFATAFNNNGVSGKTDVYVMSDLSESNIVALNVPTANPTTSSNTLTIHGNGYSIIGNGTTNYYEIMTLNGVDWLNIKGLKFKNTRSFNSGICLRITNESTDLIIDSCVFEFSALTNSQLPVGAYIAATPTNTSLTTVSTTTPSALRMTIRNCRFQTTGTGTPGPKYGIITTQLAGSNANAKPTEVSIVNNIFTNFYSQAIYSLNAMDDVYSGNNISRNDATSATILDTMVYVISVNSSYIGKKQFEIKNNYIHDLPYPGYSTGSSNVTNTLYGIYVNGSNVYVSGKSTAYHRFIVSNNLMQRCNTKNYFAGINLLSTPYTRILKNKLFDNSVQNGNKLIYVTGAANSYVNENELRRNTLSTNTAGHCVGIYVLSVTDTLMVNKNIIDSNNSACKVHMLNVTLCPRVYMFGNIVTSNSMVNNGAEFISIINSRINYIRFCSNIVSNNQGGNNHFSLYFLDNVAGTFDHVYQQNTILYAAKNNVTKHWSWYLNTNHSATLNGNITVNTGISTNYLLETTAATAKVVMNGNLYYSTLTGYSWKLVANTYSTISTWQTAVSSVREITADPRFFSQLKNEYYPQIAQAQNSVATLSDFPEDAFGRKRANPNSDFGALESNSDVQLKSVTYKSPYSICYNTNLTFSAKVKSLHSDTIKNLKIAYSINNKKYISVDKSFIINPLDTTSCVFDTKGITWYNGKNNLKIYIQVPNDSLYNDTISLSITCNKAPGSILKKLSSNQLNSPYYYSVNIPDVTILNLPWGFSIPAPSGYYNSDFGIAGKWIASATAKTKGGKTISFATLTAPNGSINAEWKLNVSDTLYQDSTFILDLVISDLVNGCDTAYHKEVYIWPVPVQKVNIPHVICQQDIVVFNHVTTSKYGLNTYKWSFGTGPRDTSILNIPQKRYDTSGIIAVSRLLTNDNYKFKFMWYDTIVVNAKPQINLSNTPACEGASFYVINKTLPSTSKMDYDFGSGIVNIQDSQFLYMYPSVGVKTFKFYANNKGCKNEVTQTINVNYMPISSFVVDGDFCEGNLLNFTNYSSITNATTLLYNWKLDSLVGSNATNATNKYPQNGIKTVSLIAKSTTGCADTSVQIIEVLSNPVANFTYSDLCNLSETKFTSTSSKISGIGEVYNWNLDKGVKATGKDVNYTWSQIGYRTISLKVTLANGCRDSISKLIEVLPLPIPKMKFKDSMCATDSVRFTNLSTNSANNPMTYQWVFQNGDSTSIANPAYLFKQYGNTVNSYKVKLKVSVLYGCKNETEQTITIKGAPSTSDFIAKPDYFAYYRGIALNPIDYNGVEGGVNGVKYKWFLQGKDTQNTSGVNAKIIYQVPIDASYWAHMWATQTGTGCVSYTAKIAIINRVSVNNIDNDQFKIYPNPAQNNLRFKTKNLNNGQLSILLFNALGQEVLNNRFDLTNDANEFELSILDISEGIYDLQIMNDGKIYTKKISIVK